MLNAVVESDDLAIGEKSVGKNDGAVKESEHGVFDKFYPIGAKPATILFGKLFAVGKTRRGARWGV